MFRQFLARPVEVGAVAASSRMLAESLTTLAGVAEASCVVELGPGTGAVTGVILEQLPETASFMALEINPDFVRILNHRFPDILVIQDSAVHLAKYLEKYETGFCDSIVSGLPFASFDDELQSQIIEAALRALKPGVMFTTFSYLQSQLLPQARSLIRALHERFSEVDRSPVIWRNVPPVYVYRAKK